MRGRPTFSQVKESESLREREDGIKEQPEVEAEDWLRVANEVRLAKRVPTVDYREALGVGAAIRTDASTCAALDKKVMNRLADGVGAFFAAVEDADALANQATRGFSPLTVPFRIVSGALLLAAVVPKSRNPAPHVVVSHLSRLVAQGLASPPDSNAQKVARRIAESVFDAPSTITSASKHGDVKEFDLVAGPNGKVGWILRVRTAKVASAATTPAPSLAPSPVAGTSAAAVAASTTTQPKRVTFPDESDSESSTSSLGLDSDSDSDDDGGGGIGGIGGRGRGRNQSRGGSRRRLNTAAKEKDAFCVVYPFDTMAESVELFPRDKDGKGEAITVSPDVAVPRLSEAGAVFLPTKLFLLLSRGVHSTAAWALACRLTMVGSFAAFGGGGKKAVEANKNAKFQREMQDALTTALRAVATYVAEARSAGVATLSDEDLMDVAVDCGAGRLARGVLEALDPRRRGGVVESSDRGSVGQRVAVYAMGGVGEGRSGTIVALCSETHEVGVKFDDEPGSVEWFDLARVPKRWLSSGGSGASGSAVGAVAASVPPSYESEPRSSFAAKAAAGRAAEEDDDDDHDDGDEDDYDDEDEDDYDDGDDDDDEAQVHEAPPPPITKAAAASPNASSSPGTTNGDARKVVPRDEDHDDNNNNNNNNNKKRSSNGIGPLPQSIFGGGRCTSLALAAAASTSVKGKENDASGAASSGAKSPPPLHSKSSSSSAAAAASSAVSRDSSPFDGEVEFIGSHPTSRPSKAMLGSVPISTSASTSTAPPLSASSGESSTSGVRKRTITYRFQPATKKQSPSATSSSKPSPSEVVDLTDD